jgi:hypothetical protein
MLGEAGGRTPFVLAFRESDVLGLAHIRFESRKDSIQKNPHQQIAPAIQAAAERRLDELARGGDVPVGAEKRGDSSIGLRRPLDEAVDRDAAAQFETCVSPTSDAEAG